VSEGSYESLNLGILTGDDRDRVAENRRRVVEAAALEPGSIAWGLQVHGADLAEWDGPHPGGDPPEADAHLTRRSGLGLLVLVADCLPVALASDCGVAMVHCGWRGLAGGILGKAVDALGGTPAAAAGPGIGRCCYEVGEEVLAEFAELDDVSAGRMLDLRAVADAQLRAAGVERIEHVDLCTSCHPELFFSHRRDAGVTGRQGGLVVRA
jgi:YfiH family protein